MHVDCFLVWLLPADCTPYGIPKFYEQRRPSERCKKLAHTPFVFLPQPELQDSVFGHLMPKIEYSGKAYAGAQDVNNHRHKDVYHGDPDPASGAFVRVFV
jgi:hypothetical protein